MKKVLFTLLACSLLVNTAQAQTGWTLRWVQPGATPAVAGAYLYSLRIDAGAAINVDVVCLDVAGATTCSTPLPVISTPGQHTIALTASNAFGASAPATLTGAPPSTPITLTVTVTVTIP